MATLSGYRETDRALLTGHWLPGELLGRPLADRPRLAEPVTIDPAGGHVYVVRERAVVRFADVDWVHRRARLEIGLRPGVADGDCADLVARAVRHGLRVLNLRRLYGWVTPVAGIPAAALSAAGFVEESLVPQAIWFAGGPVDRQLWGVVCDD